jgi:hypothetical protein
VAPGTFKVTLEVDGVAAGSRTFEVRGDPASAVTLAEHKAREAFVVEVMDLQAKVETLVTGLRTRSGTATGEEAARLQAIQQRLSGGGGGRRGGGAAAGGPAAPGGPAPGPAIAQRLNTLIGPFRISGATTGTMTGPTGAMRAELAAVKTDLAAIEKDIK